MSLLSRYLGPRQAFDGGLFLPDQKAGYARQPIETLPADGPLNVPLAVKPDWTFETIVSKGDHVLRGSRLSNPLVTSGLPAHSPVSGHVAKISRAWTPHGGFVASAVIEPDGRNESLPPSHGWEDESIIVQLARCAVMCNSPSMALHEYLVTAISLGAGDLIVNAMETEPYLAADLRTIVEEPGRIVDATCELADALGVVRAMIAVPFRHRRVVRRLKSEAEGRSVDIVAMADVYPQCHPVLLVKSLLDREIAPGGSTLDEGAVVLPLSAVRAAAAALLDDTPVTHVAITVAGDAIERPGVYRTAIGTPISRLAKRVGLSAPVHQAVFGGPLTGITIGDENAVVTADCAAVLLFAGKPAAIEAPCIRCGWCVEDCPVGIAPTDFIGIQSPANLTPMELSQTGACIDCGLCTHVCPSQIPLAQSIRRIREGRNIKPETADATA